MKREGDYFVKITHLVFLDYKGKKYKREECIINGQVSLFWNYLRDDVDDDIYETVSSQMEINELNKAYFNMSYLENFKK